MTQPSSDLIDDLEERASRIRGRLFHTLDVLTERGEYVQRVLKTAEEAARRGVVTLSMFAGLGLLHLLSRPRSPEIAVRRERRRSSVETLRVAGTFVLAGIAGFMILRRALRVRPDGSRSGGV